MKAALIVILLAAAGAIGDFFIKLSGSGPRFDVRLLAVGAIIYLSTIGGWFYALRHIKLSSLGAVYAITTVLLFVAIGVFYFHEKLSVYEIVGIIGAVASVLLLSRFA
ncbi:MAG: transporter [Patescibacteria group bacterium]